ncbi:MAG: hypothetical protein U1F68_00650 [Gammaproteobacteria bacterium]
MKPAPQEAMIRIRPQNLAVLVDAEIDLGVFLDLLKFLSCIWGGKYARIIIVGRQSNDFVESLRIDLAKLMPDVVLLAEEGNKIWEESIFEICRPQIVIFNDKALDGLKNSTFAGLIHADTAVRAEVSQHPQIQRDWIYLQEHHGVDQYSLYLAVTFGFVPENAAKEYSKFLRAKHALSRINDYSTYMDAHDNLLGRWCWLDVANNRLQLIHGTIAPPTVIIVNKSNPLKDLVLYWNMRPQFRSVTSGEIILFPDTEIVNDHSIDRLANWITDSRIQSSWCELHSHGCSKGTLNTLARRLRPRLRRKKLHAGVQIIDVHVNVTPLISFCYEREEHANLLLEDHVVTVPKLSPWLDEQMPSSGFWCCDLAKNPNNQWC